MIPAIYLIFIQSISVTENKDTEFIIILLDNEQVYAEKQAKDDGRMKTWARDAFTYTDASETTTNLSNTFQNTM
jgi:hypothetical protein